jgi:hypothetical protein
MNSLREKAAGNDSSSGRGMKPFLSRPLRPARQSGLFDAKAELSDVKPEEAVKNRLTFAEDYGREHSRFGLRIAMSAVPRGSGAAPRKSRQSECFGFLS